MVYLYSLFCFRKDKPIGRLLGSSLSWAEALDACADVYNGVSFAAGLSSVQVLMLVIVCLLVFTNFARRQYLV